MERTKSDHYFVDLITIASTTNDALQTANFLRLGRDLAKLDAELRKKPLWFINALKEDPNLKDLLDFANRTPWAFGTNTPNTKKVALETFVCLSRLRYPPQTLYPIGSGFIAVCNALATALRIIDSQEVHYWPGQFKLTGNIDLPTCEEPRLNDIANIFAYKTANAGFLRRVARVLINRLFQWQAQSTSLLAVDDETYKHLLEELEHAAIHI